MPSVWLRNAQLPLWSDRDLCCHRSGSSLCGERALPPGGSYSSPSMSGYDKSVWHFCRLLFSLHGVHPYGTQMWKKTGRLSIRRNSPWLFTLDIVHVGRELAGHELPWSLRFQIVPSSCCLYFKQWVLFVSGDRHTFCVPQERLSLVWLRSSSYNYVSTSKTSAWELILWFWLNIIFFFHPYSPSVLFLEEGKENSWQNPPKSSKTSVNPKQRIFRVTWQYKWALDATEVIFNYIIQLFTCERTLKRAEDKTVVLQLFYN